MAAAPDGRIYLGGLTGEIRVMRNGQVQPDLFAALTTSAKAGQGLLGIALDPNFASNGWVYVWRVVDSGKGIRDQLSRVTAGGNVMVPGSEVVLFTTPVFQFPPNGPPHNGGEITFGADGKIYIPMGDHGTSAIAQNLNYLAGKLLRLNPDGSIPTDNPYYKSTRGVQRAIYAVGLRNPYTVAAQPGTGLVYVNDVGEASYEEIDQALPRANFGWPNSEGPVGLTKKLAAPIYTYSHYAADTDPVDTAIIGGAFYNIAQPSFPSAYTGLYFFADHHSGWIKTLNPQTRQVASFATQLPDGITSLTATPDGRLLYLVFHDSTDGTSELRQIAYTPASPPALLPTSLSSQTVALGRTASFQVAPTGTGPFTYQWFVNGNLQSTDPVLTMPADPSQSGCQVRVVVSNGFGSTTSNVASMTVLNVSPPQAYITKPTMTRRYPPGSAITFAGMGIDPQDGTLGPQAFTWSVDLIQNGADHPAVWQRSGTMSGKFWVPSYANSGQVSFQVNLTVTDSAGVSTTVSRVFPVRG